MTIYIDTDYKCHTSNPDGVYTAVETAFFDGKCEAYIEGYRYVPVGESWTRQDGVTFAGEMIVPWKPLDELNEAQKQYEWNKLTESLPRLEETVENSSSAITSAEERIAELEAQNEMLMQCVLEMSEIVYA